MADDIPNSLDEACREISRLKELLKNKDVELTVLRREQSNKDCKLADGLHEEECSINEKKDVQCNDHPKAVDKLSNYDIARYSRQIILPELGVKGQIALRCARVLVVGCGGLGCPAAIYLAAAGIGTIGLVDYDVVELSNLHRQIMHTEEMVDRNKTDSLTTACSKVNSSIKIVTYNMALLSNNALSVINLYDIVLDATDNIATRYLLNDACVLAKKPLVSGSALRFEGQLTVYNYKESPCYRCLYPIAPPPEAVTNCSDGGVIGAVVGIIGSMQAMEAIKIVANIGSSLAGRLVLYDGLDATLRCVKLRGRQTNCAVCSATPTVTSLIDYEQFCGASATDKEKGVDVLPREERITVKEYQSIVERQERHLLVDVRQPVELDICQLSTTTHNVPLDRMDVPGQLDDIVKLLKEEVVPVYMLCRRGNDSQLAVNKLRMRLLSNNEGNTDNYQIKDIVGGLHAWAKHVDPLFPIY